MYSVASRHVHRIDPIKGSRFLATVAPISSEAEAKAFAQEVEVEHSDASHHCSAWRIARPSIDRCNDDGEPSGSAGRPILAQLAGRELVNVAVIVTRYFGGTKLGVGGLIRAYGSAASSALDTAELVAYEHSVTFTATATYEDAEAVGRALPAAGATITATDYADTVTFQAAIAEARLGGAVAAVADATAGRALIRHDSQVV